jgi:hypothetical protein
MLGSSWVTAHLAASEEGLSVMSEWTAWNEEPGIKPSKTLTWITCRDTIRYVTPWSWVHLEKPIVAQQLKRFSAFMEREDSVLLLQEIFTGLRPEANEPTLQVHILCYLDSFFIVSSSGYQQIFANTFLLSHTYYIPCTSHSHWFYHSNSILWNSFLRYLLQPPITLFILGQNFLLSTLFSSLCSSIIRATKFHTRTKLQVKL